MKRERFVTRITAMLLAHETLEGVLRVYLRPWRSRPRTGIHLVMAQPVLSGAGLRR